MKEIHQMFTRCQAVRIANMFIHLLTFSNKPSNVQKSQGSYGCHQWRSRLMFSHNGEYQLLSDIGVYCAFFNLVSDDHTVSKTVPYYYILIRNVGKIKFAPKRFLRL